MHINRICGVMVSVLASGAVDPGFELRLGQTKDNELGICCSFAKYAALRRKNKDWLARNQNNVSVWSDMSTRGLLFQWANNIKIIFSVLAKNKADLIIISLKINLFSPWYSWKIAELAFNNNHSLTHPHIHITTEINLVLLVYYYFWVLYIKYKICMLSHVCEATCI